MIYCEAGDNITVGQVTDRDNIAVDISDKGHSDTKDRLELPIVEYND